MSSDDEVQLTHPVRKWAAMKRLSDAAADILVERLGFDSMEALALLTADDLQNCGMLRGQQKLVVQGVRNTFPTTQRHRAQDNSQLKGMYSWQDPQIYLKVSE